MDGDGQVKNTVTKDYPLSFPRPGWSEQDPAHWWTAVLEGVAFAIRDSFEVAKSLGIDIPRSNIAYGAVRGTLPAVQADLSRV